MEPEEKEEFGFGSVDEDNDNDDNNNNDDDDEDDHRPEDDESLRAIDALNAFSQSRLFKSIQRVIIIFSFSFVCRLSFE